MRGSSRNGSMDNLSSGPGSPAHGASNGGSQHSNVYVKNLSEDVDELTLKGVFDKFGAVESCCVIRDVSTNSSRGAELFAPPKKPLSRQGTNLAVFLHPNHNHPTITLYR